MTRGERRDAKRQKAKYGMQVSGRSVQRLQEITEGGGSPKGDPNFPQKAAGRDRVKKAGGVTTPAPYL